MKRAKKRILRRIVWIGMILMAAGFLTGCMETSEDDCIVKEKETVLLTYNPGNRHNWCCYYSC